MPRSTDIRKSGFIPIPKDMDRQSYKIEIISSGTTYDVTDYNLNTDFDRVATEGVSTFTLNLDNNDGRFVGKFSEGDPVNIYYNFKVKSELTTIRFRGYIDSIYDNFDISNGFTLIIDGRDIPKGRSNEHFVDTHITLQCNGRNNLDCWLGTEGTKDTEGNYPDGVLYNSGMILKVYDTSDNDWKSYTNMSTAQKDTLKSQTGYTATHSNTYIDKSRLSMSQPLASEGDYDFRIYYHQSDTKTYFMVHPENAIINNLESISAGQNLISLNRYGKDTTEEYNRIKETGFTDGNLLLMRTKQDFTRQDALWIKDKEETTNSLTTDDELVSKANARLNELKLALKKGTCESCALPTLQPAEKINFNLPYVAVEPIKVKSFSVSLSDSILFTLNLQDRETTFSKILKDKFDANVSATSSNNPNGMMNGIVFDFSNPDEYNLSDTQIEGEVLSLENGEVTGKCTTPLHVSDLPITHCELRINANQFWNCTYRISNDSRVTWETIVPGELHTFSSTGNGLVLEITLNESTSGVSPEFNKINLLYKL